MIIVEIVQIHFDKATIILDPYQCRTVIAMHWAEIQLWQQFIIPCQLFWNGKEMDKSPSWQSLT